MSFLVVLLYRFYELPGYGVIGVATIGTSDWKIPTTEATDNSFGLDDLGTEWALSRRSGLELFPLDLFHIRLDEQRMGQSYYEQRRRN
ncbi:MAG: hypothetical protein P4L56_22650 [Candidatus Sulfopaludibacter sp.]|nr:hypothetical protein [Candidatus Sulfopaludibacter sp.]